MSDIQEALRHLTFLVEKLEAEVQTLRTVNHSLRAALDAARKERDALKAKLDAQSAQ